MNIRHMALTIFILAGLPAAVAYPDKLPQFGTHTRDQFQDYWYNHGPEISRFSLQQMRYGEIHQGDAVLVFVTEKMNPDIQIKADHPGSQDIAILKLSGMKPARAQAVWGSRFLPPVLPGRTPLWILIGSIAQTKTAGGLMLLASVHVKWEGIEGGIRNAEGGNVRRGELKVEFGLWMVY